jgi:site-specific DNA recombinase
VEFGAIRRLLSNEALTGKHIWGRTRQERRPGTRQIVERALPRADWRIADRPDLRIISDEIWEAARQRRAQIAGAMRQPGNGLMRGRNAAMYSRHLFSGFLRCGVCGGAVTVVSGGFGTPRYGCARHSRNGVAFCANRLTIRARVADAALLAGLQTELRRPETVSYLADRLTSQLNEVIDSRPQRRDTLERQQRDVQERLQRLVAAVESGQGSAALFQAIRAREAEIDSLTTQIVALDEPLAERLAVIPTWVRQQLEDTAGLLSEHRHARRRNFSASTSVSQCIRYWTRGRVRSGVRSDQGTSIG